MLGNGSIVRHNPRQTQECTPSDPCDSDELRSGVAWQSDASAFSLHVGFAVARPGNRPVTDFRLVPIVAQQCENSTLPVSSSNTVASTLSCRRYKLKLFARSFNETGRTHGNDYLDTAIHGFHWGRFWEPIPTPSPWDRGN